MTTMQRPFSTYQDTILRRLWVQPNVSLGEVCRQLNATSGRVTRRAAELELGERAARLDGPNGWSAERIKLMTNLWQGGLSASQIAKQLGGVTRNAVIGKLSRLGVSGRAMPSKPAKLPRPPKVRAPSPPKALKAPKPEKPQRVKNPLGTKSQMSPSALRAHLIQSAPEKVTPSLNLAGKRTVLTIQAGECKWPFGDPASPTFTFCGEPAPRAPYCESCRIRFKPFQPQVVRNRVDERLEIIPRRHARHG